MSVLPRVMVLSATMAFALRCYVTHTDATNLFHDTKSPQGIDPIAHLTPAGATVTAEP